ncbi:hypothetical protein FQA39_LY15643 [Lamprigera yunnana]|nr:hypothetical protein FQA39_LY15643 [Lamprigera yunnana]
MKQVLGWFDHLVRMDEERKRKENRGSKADVKEHSDLEKGKNWKAAKEIRKLHTLEDKDDKNYTENCKTDKKVMVQVSDPHECGQNSQSKKKRQQSRALSLTQMLLKQATNEDQTTRKKRLTIGIKEKKGLNKYQFGFRKGRTTIDCP